MSTEENKALVRRFWQAGNEHSLKVFDDLMTTDYIQHDTTGDMSVDDLKAYNTMNFSAFPDINFSIDDIIAEGDRVVTRLTISGTHKGELRGMPPTGKTATITGISIYRISEGKIAEGWVLSDRLGMMQQLGVIPPR
jgi:steroid delta-isomerase-like uncharacterized protein